MNTSILQKEPPGVYIPPPRPDKPATGVGAVIGGALGAIGGFFVGGPVGAVAGGAVGAAAGAAVGSKT